MELDKTIDKRKSIKDFNNKKVSWRAVVEIVDAAIKIPCAGGKNPFMYVITEDPEKIAKLAKASEQPWITAASVVIAVTSDDKQLESLYDQKGRIYSRQQAGAAIQNMLLKITDLDLAGCWVGAYNDIKIKDILRIPKTNQVD